MILSNLQSFYQVYNVGISGLYPRLDTRMRMRRDGPHRTNNVLWVYQTRYVSKLISNGVM